MRAKALVWIFLTLIGITFVLYFFYTSERRSPSLQVSSSLPQEITKSVPEDTWKLFSTDLFSMQLPDIPQHISERVPQTNSQDLITYDMYLLQQPVGSTFMLSLIQYPESFDTTTPEKILESITQEMLTNNAESKLKVSEMGTFLGAPSITNVIGHPSLYIFMKAFLVGKTLYVINIVDEQENRAKMNSQKVLDSFRLHDV